MAEIGEYVTDFARLVGEDAAPRFYSLRNGSMKLKVKIPRENEFDVKSRGFLLRTGDAPEDALRAQDRISKRLGMHRAKRATILDSTDTKIVEIPITKSAGHGTTVPSMTKSGSVQGQVIRIGGKQDIVSVELQDVDGHIYFCKAKRDIAKTIAREIFGSTVRANGTGRWTRDDDGVWHVEDFQIATFEVLDDDPLGVVVAQARSIHSEWQDQDDPLIDAGILRSGH